MDDVLDFPADPAAPTTPHPAFVDYNEAFVDFVVVVTVSIMLLLFASHP